MNKYDFPYYELRINQNTQVAEPVRLVRSFFTAESPQEMKLLQYQNMMLSIVDMPLWVRVILGFVGSDKIQPDLAEDRFTFNGLSPNDFKELYDCIENFLLTILCNEDKTLVDSEDLLFLRSYLTDDNCENFSPSMFSLLAEIMITCFLAVSNKSFFEKHQTEGKNVFEVLGRKFLLPAKAIMELVNSKAAEQNIGKVEFDSIMRQHSQNQFNGYSTWQATTAIDFYELSQHFDIIENGTHISRESLNAGNKIEFRNSAAAIFAALSREIKNISNDGKVELQPKQELSLQELEQHTAEMINFFNENLTMQEVHQCNFFFANSITHTKNFIALPFRSPVQQTKKRVQPKKKK